MLREVRSQNFLGQDYGIGGMGENKIYYLRFAIY